MTNTNDFRRYSYENDPAYLIQSFSQSRSSAAPKRKPVEEPNSNLKLRDKNDVQAKVKSLRQVQSESKATALRAIICCIAAALLIAMFAVTLNSFAMKNELTRRNASLQTQISNAQSESISLQSQLDAMVSIGTIEDYAVNKLHMVKMDSSEVQYVDVDQYKQNRMEMINKANAKVESNK